MTGLELISLLPLLLAVLVPGCLFIAAFLISRQRARYLTIAAVVTTLTAYLAYLAVILYSLLSLIGYDARTELSGSAILDVVQLDIVSSFMFVLVSTLALIVVRYSRTYLAGQRDLDRYARSLLLTLASVSVLVTSNNLAVLVVAWFATDVGLHSLLTFYRTRREAIIVAHKKFLLCRLADACFVASLVIIGPEVGSLRIDVVGRFAQANGELSPTLHLATVLLVFGVLLKSAQLPFHGWMTQVMEAPTPVSALLHAGVVNIGGFVMIRLAPLMAHASIAQSVLLGVGLFTTVAASLMMTARVSIKGVLAWSTIGQMGFMLVQCGLGAWHLALMHLLAHSLYKCSALADHRRCGLRVHGRGAPLPGDHSPDGARVELDRAAHPRAGAWPGTHDGASICSWATRAPAGDAVRSRRVGVVFRLARRLRSDRAFDQHGAHGVDVEVADRHRRAWLSLRRADDLADAPERPARQLAPATSPEWPLYR